MPTMVLRDPGHIDALSRRLSGRKLPLTVSWSQGASRSSQQQRLSFQWFMDISRQLGDMTVEEVRADAKVSFGVPILRAETESFRASWDETFGQLDHEAQRRAVERLQVPVTSLMTVKQMTAFLDAMQRHWLPLGIRMTDPEALKYEEEFR
ncbi:hypothetical protein [Pseudogemmobacter sonorensis]|uniref:hypothetical protein n=1 Tax=Pseudogemmobacter sonorensis TaxID=2989681 RepID=UPI00368DCB39